MNCCFSVLAPLLCRPRTFTTTFSHLSKVSKINDYIRTFSEMLKLNPCFELVSLTCWGDVKCLMILLLKSMSSTCTQNIFIFKICENTLQTFFYTFTDCLLSFKGKPGTSLLVLIFLKYNISTTYETKFTRKLLEKNSNEYAW